MRIHIVLPDEMIKEIDEFVGQRKRSEFSAAAAEEQHRRLRLVRAINVAIEFDEDGEWHGFSWIPQP